MATKTKFCLRMLGKSYARSNTYTGGTVDFKDKNGTIYYQVPTVPGIVPIPSEKKIAIRPTLLMSSQAGISGLIFVIMGIIGAVGVALLICFPQLYR
jgi:hypothetical protein